MWTSTLTFPKSGRHVSTATLLPNLDGCSSRSTNIPCNIRQPRSRDILLSGPLLISIQRCLDGPKQFPILHFRSPNNVSERLNIPLDLIPRNFTQLRRHSSRIKSRSLGLPHNLYPNPTRFTGMKCSNRPLRSCKYRRNEVGIGQCRRHEYKYLLDPRNCCHKSHHLHIPLGPLTQWSVP